jgi:NAD(P)-dependent dehydrogenase (short-subunit alcohol dehydrogenase family)
VTDGTCKRLMLFVPPRHGKSEMVTVRYPVWRIERDPAYRVIVAAHTQRLVNKFSRKSRRIAGERLALSGDKKAVEEWETTAGGGVRAKQGAPHGEVNLAEGPRLGRHPAGGCAVAAAAAGARGGAPAAPRSPPARVIHVSSGGGLTVRCDVQGLPTGAGACKGGTPAGFDGTLQYAHSKRAQMLLAEAWAQRLPQDRVGVYSMHPGWADTEGVRTALPAFREQHKGSLRSEAQGADTAVWLAAAQQLPSAASGQLLFDRAVVPQHYACAGTASTPADKAALWEACAAACSWRPE